MISRRVPDESANLMLNAKESLNASGEFIVVIIGKESVQPLLCVRRVRSLS